ncbi:uncharacterized protein [Procambarus clarkii]|uniref:uncharacterized protein isoform X2 n=1 Tax=Procambarus clarkii TaxID=6728 RepID=UPI003743ED4C
MVDQWTVVWWCLMVITADAGLASGVEECFLYPVKKGEQSPSVPLQASSDTIISINNIYDNNTITTITTDDGDCVARVLHNSTHQPRKDGCPVLDASAVDTSTGTWQELVTVVVHRGGGRTSVYLRDSGDEEQLVKVHLGDASTVHVVSQEFVNVAYGCCHGCFQFQKATIHKSFSDGRPGSLLFYGQLTGSGPPKGTIYALRDAGWNQRRGFYPQDSIMNNTHWFAFRALPEYTRDNRGKDILSLTLRYETATSSCSPEDPACNPGQITHFVGDVPSKDLYLTFYATENVRWAVFCRPLATSQEPGEEDQPALTTTTSPTTINWSLPLNNSCQINDCQEMAMLWRVMWSALVLAVVCVLLLLVTVFLNIIIVRRQPPPSRPSHPNTVPLAVTSLPNNDPANHIYDYLEPDPL